MFLFAFWHIMRDIHYKNIICSQTFSLALLEYKHDFFWEANIPNNTSFSVNWLCKWGRRQSQQGATGNAQNTFSYTSALCKVLSLSVKKRCHCITLWEIISLSKKRLTQNYWDISTSPFNDSFPIYMNFPRYFLNSAWC